jgi:regulator of sirC expression with transglutaminase-like and TPR domain
LKACRFQATSWCACGCAGRCWCSTRSPGATRSRRPTCARQILARLLRNLKGIYREADKPERLLDVLNRMLTVAPEAHGELRERGLLYQRLECYRAALKDLTDYSTLEPDAADAEEVRASVMQLSAICARLN